MEEEKRPNCAQDSLNTTELVVPVTSMKSHYWEQWENKRCVGSDSLSVSFLQVILWLPQMESVITIIRLGVWKGSGTKKFTVHPKRWHTGSIAVQEGTAWGEETPHYFRLGLAPQGSTHCWLQGSELATGQWCHTCPADLPTSLRRWSPDLSPKGKETNRRPESPQQINRILMGKTKDRQTWIPLCRS